MTHRRPLFRSLTLALLAGGLAAVAAPASAQFSFVVGGNGKRVDGSGNLIEDVRNVESFNGVVVNGPIDVRLKSGSAERVVVHADDNIAPLIETRVQDGKLIVTVVSGASFRTRSRLYAAVDFKQLSSLSIRGSGDALADHVKADIFETTIRGSGDVVIETLESDVVALSISGSGDFVARGGRAAKLGVVIVGSGDVRTEKLESRDVAVRIRGSGDAWVQAAESLQVDIAGSGDVRYKGEPKISRKIAGSGELIPIR